MARRATPPPLDLRSLLESWLLHLRAERKSPATVKQYGDGVRRFLAWCDDTGTAPVLDRPTVNEFVAVLLEEGAEAATARARQLALRRFSAWLLEEGEIDQDLLLGIKAPKLDTKVTPSLTEDELKRLLKACSGKDLRDRRDEALIRFMAETGARAGEVTSLTLADVDLTRGLAVVRRGKGGKGRTVPFGAQTGRALDRYLRLRRGHLRADSPAFWLGDRGKEFGYYALHKTLKWRAELAGIADFHPHVLRHTAAARWLAAGGSEGGLMAVAGWARRDMIDRYTAHTAASRAADEARALNLGDL
ncbi:tyrosine-type recombinase/integrase [Rhodococcus pyridinivorans]|uniref:tyrosine-type recombinase/integrase n=1 Tax=Rhodococcus pyridinivorans TaxID=103816 RepID=UPI002283CF40|nr:tyrosine-type recombinase/integrase [Rhodococcus pyridinivorans]WAL48419.1 tyrosine-type recombinase/integrase [Rhodococcus pyridinivorans]